jgi:hypothetical protein
MRVPRRRLLVIFLAVLVPLIAGTVAYSATSPSPGKSGSAPGKQKAGQESTEKENEAEGQGIPGGSIERFHSDCDLPDGVAPLEGNWTHGMYVSAWATTNDPTKIVEAAHSRCGKPSHAGLGHFGAGGLPPGLAKKAENQPAP